MKRNSRVGLITAIIICAVLVCFLMTYTGRTIYNTWQYNLQKIDDATTYQTRKKVEDACRSMITSYTADSLVYKQYAQSDSSEHRSWAEQAKMRANKTAAEYNEYILKNSFVFEGNIPSDIARQLAYIE